jgi:hypothetical protein
MHQWCCPRPSSGRFWLDGCRWQTPAAEDVEMFVERLVRHEVIALDPAQDPTS